MTVVADKYHQGVPTDHFLKWVGSRTPLRTRHRFRDPSLAQLAVLAQGLGARMLFNVPDIESNPTFDAQSVDDATDLAALVVSLSPATTGAIVVSGCGVVSNSAMTSTYAAGSVYIAGAAYSPAQTTVTFAAASSTDRRDIVVWTVGTGYQVIEGTPCGTAGWTRSANPATNPPPVKPAIPANSVLIDEVYIAFTTTSIAAGNHIDKRVMTQTSAPQSVSVLGSKIQVFGHSYAAAGGASSAVHAWPSILAGLTRSRLWNCAVGGASLCFANVTAGTVGFGGIAALLQQLVPTPQPVNWTGAYSSTTTYNPNDGVTAAFTVASCTTTNNSTTVSTTNSFNTAPIVAGMYVAGTGIAEGTYVAAVNSATSLTLSQNATASGTVTLTFTGWYRQESFGAISNAAPSGATGNAWVLVTPASLGIAPYYLNPTAAGVYLPPLELVVLNYGADDMGVSFNRSDQCFLSALEAALSRAQAAVVWNAGSPMISTTGSGWSPTYTFATLGYPAGSGNEVTQVSTTSGDTLSVTTPPDFPGGYVTFGFWAAPPNTSSQLNFSVDGVATNSLCSGQSAASAITFASPLRYRQRGTSLATALASGVAVTSLAVEALPGAVTSGDTIQVGSGGTTDTFTANGSAAAGATSISVTSHAPSNSWAVGSPVRDTVYAVSWIDFNDIVVRVPVGAGSHTVTATVPASANNADLFFNYVQLEVPANAPLVLVLGLTKVLNYSLYWPAQPSDADMDTWNTAIKGMIGPGSEFPGAVFVDVTNVLRPGATTLTTALTAGQTNVTSLAVNPLTEPMANGDVVQIGGGVTSQQVVLSAAASAGATSLSVNSFTSTYAQAIGTAVFDYTQSAAMFLYDGVHPNDMGHAAIAEAVYQALLAANVTLPTAVVETGEVVRPSVAQFLSGSGNIAVGTGTANAWGGPLSTLQLIIPADPGDVLEVTVNGLWDTSATVSGYLDIMTYNPGTNVAINYFSGVAHLGDALAGIGYNVVGGQAASGLVSLQSPSAGAAGTQVDRIIGRFLYPVQPADIVNGVVTLGFVGKSSATTDRHIALGSGNVFSWDAKNLGPFSYQGES